MNDLQIFMDWFCDAPVVTSVETSAAEQDEN